MSILSSSELHLYNQKYSKTVIMWNSIAFIPVMEKLHFHKPLYWSVTWFFRNHSNVDLVLKKHFLLSMLKTVFAA